MVWPAGVGLSFIAVVGVAITMVLIDKAGRRVFTVPPQWIVLVIFLVLGLWSSAPEPLVLVLFLVFSFLNAMNGVLTSVYPGEVFPTEVRGVGTGFAVAISRVGAALGTFLLPVGIERMGDRPGAPDPGRRGGLGCDRVAAVGTGDQGQEPGRNRSRIRPLTHLLPDRRTHMTIAVAHSDSDRGLGRLETRGGGGAVPRPAAGRPAHHPRRGRGDKRGSGGARAGRRRTIRLRRRRLDAANRAPEGFDTAEALLDLAEEVDASLLVIGSRHRTRVGKLLLGSTVQRVLLEAQLPVLVVKAS